MIGELCGPLYNKLKGNSRKSNETITWTDDESEVFQVVKNELVQVGSLAAPNMNPGAPPFIIQTDAGDNAMGAVLLQASVTGGDPRPIKFVSQAFNEAQKKYATPQKEQDRYRYDKKPSHSQNKPGSNTVPKTVRSICWTPENTEAKVNALATQERDVQMRDVGDWTNNPNMYTYREVSDQANDLLMEAFVAGMTKVPNSVFLNHPEIFKQHRVIQMKGRKREGIETGNYPNNLNHLSELSTMGQLTNVNSTPNQ
ncbi:hypothetical protein HMI55_002978 [Coelomomyces lativittatus]|nr:hypothetical protein HMI55_002978 [Coelomomyces lativittatus]